MSAPDTLTPQDLAMMRDAYQALTQAQAILAFVEQQIGARYAIKPGDSVDVYTGAIKRPQQPGAD